MHWYRTYRRRLVWIGLAALAGQIALTFGHVHAHGSEGTPHEAAAAAATVLALQHGGDHSDTGHREDSDVPEDSDDVDLVCVYCRTMVQAETLVLPNLPPVPAEHQGPRFSPVPAADAFGASERALPFAARAPPPMSTVKA